VGTLALFAVLVLEAAGAEQGGRIEFGTKLFGIGSGWHQLRVSA